MKWFVFPKKESKSGSLLFSLEVVGVIASVWTPYLQLSAWTREPLNVIKLQMLVTPY